MLLMGTILIPGKRMVTETLRVMGLSENRHLDKLVAMRRIQREPNQARSTVLVEANELIQHGC